MLPAKSCQRKKSSEGGLRSVQSDEWIPDGHSHRVVQFCTGDHWKKDTGWNTGEDSPYKLRILFWSQNPLGNFGESLWIAHFACHIPACQMEVPKSTWGDFLAPTNPRASSKNCIFLLNCISKTGIASGIFAERSLYEVSGFPINLWRTDFVRRVNFDIVHVLWLKPVNDLSIAVTDFQARSEEREFSWLDIWVRSVGDNNWNSNYDSFLVLWIGNCGSFLWLGFQWCFPELAAKWPPRRRLELCQQPSGEKRELEGREPIRRSCCPTSSKQVTAD